MNDYQGKRKEQVEYSEKVAAGSMILMIIIMLATTIPMLPTCVRGIKELFIEEN